MPGRPDRRGWTSCSSALRSGVEAWGLAVASPVSIGRRNRVYSITHNCTHDAEILAVAREDSAAKRPKFALDYAENPLIMTVSGWRETSLASQNCIQD